MLSKMNCDILSSYGSLLSSRISSSRSKDIHSEDDTLDMNGLDPSEVKQNQLDIEKNRVGDILTDLMDCLSISLNLDVLIKNQGTLLAPFLSTEELENVLKIFDKIQLMGMSYSSNLSVKNEFLVDIELCGALSALGKLPHIAVVGRSILQEHSGSPASHLYMALTLLNTHFFKRMNTTAKEERDNDEYIVRVWEKNEKAKQKIKKLTLELENKRKAFTNLRDKKESYIQKHQSGVDSLDTQCNEQIQYNAMVAERRMANEWSESNARQKELKEESKQIRTAYDTLLAAHLDKEKQSRAKRLKVETQLLNWIQKYDSEMGERRDRYDILLKKYEDETYLLNDLTSKFNEQAVMYDALMSEKKKYLYEVWCVRYHSFVINTAARHIQRWYRKIQKQVAAKRKAAMKAHKSSLNERKKY